MHCQAWNTLIETIAEKSVSRFSPPAAISQVQNLGAVEAREEPRFPTGIDELDRVLGGGGAERLSQGRASGDGAYAAIPVAAMAQLALWK